MRRGTSFGVSVARAVALVALGLGLLAPADAGKPGGGTTGPKFKITDLGYMDAYCINDDGVIGGQCRLSDGLFHPVLVVPEDQNGDGTPDCWFKDSDGDGVNDLLVTLEYLGSSGGDKTGWVAGANGAGEYVGSSLTDGDTHYHAALWRDTDGDGYPEEVTDLGTLEIGVGRGASDINASGWVTVRSGQAGGVIVPRDGVWNQDEDGDGINDLMIDLVSFPPASINAAGQVTSGGCLLEPSDGDGDGIPETWVGTALPGLDGSYGTSGTTSIHSSGRVAGWSKDSSSLFHAVYWKADLSIVDLGKPSTGFSATARDLFVDGSGVVCVVGDENKPSRRLFHDTNIALYWVGSTKYTLYNQLTDKTGVAAMESATDINSSGLIIGVLERTSGGRAAYVAVPVND